MWLAASGRDDRAARDGSRSEPTSRCGEAASFAGKHLAMLRVARVSAHAPDVYVHVHADARVHVAWLAASGTVAPLAVACRREHGECP